MKWADQLFSLLFLFSVFVGCSEAWNLASAQGSVSPVRSPPDPYRPKKPAETKAQTLTAHEESVGIALPFGDIVLQEWAVGIGLGSGLGAVTRLHPSHQTALQASASKVLSRPEAWSISVDTLVYAFEPLSGLPFSLDAYAGIGMALITWSDDGFRQTAQGRIKREKNRRWAANLRCLGGLSSYIAQPLLEIYLDVGLDVDLVPLNTPGLLFSGGVLWRIPGKRH